MGSILGEAKRHVQADDDSARKKTDEADREDELEAPHGSTARQLLHTTLVAVEANRRALRRLEFVFAIGLVCLLAGTIVLGLYMTFPLP